MKIDKSRTAAFTGHRSFKINASASSLFSSGHDAGSIEERVFSAVEDLCERGYDTFLCGMAEGFDLLAATAVLRLRREKCAGIRLLAVVPFPGQARSYEKDVKECYDEVLAQASEVITICDTYSYNCFHLRNDFLVDNASSIICYYNGAKGGTAYTVRRAIKSGTRIMNLHL